MTKIQKIGYSQQRAPKINKKSAHDKSFFAVFTSYIWKRVPTNEIRKQKRTRCSNKNYGIKQQDN
jgi:hypothetical protein